MDDKVLSYKTLYDESANSKSKVYFTCHPDDFSRYFDPICKDILGCQNCVIFYTENMSCNLEDENVLADLERMNLFVFPITFKLLTTENRSIDFDLKYALEKHIPVLPIMVEPGLYDLYSKKDKFGELQYLNPFSKDLTAIKYLDKLNTYLESVLISDEQIAMIKSAFDAYVFLSYRKQDRKYANEIMKLVHDSLEYEGIAVWYDEFLTPGQSFRSNIGRKLADSKLMILLVTPSILKRHLDGSPNFVMGTEYPLADRLFIPVLPVEMEVTDKEMLEFEYPNIPDCISSDNVYEIKQKLIELIPDMVGDANNSNPMHMYLLGLAYLKGIDVEIDTDRGIRLIVQAAKMGLFEAMNKLYDMYANGDGVELDYEKALECFESTYELRIASDGEESIDNLSFLNNLAMAYGLHGKKEKCLELHKKCYRLRRNVLGYDHIDTLFSLNELAFAYSRIDDNKRGLELHKKCYELSEKARGENYPDTIIYLGNYAYDQFVYSNQQDGIKLFYKCYKLLRKNNGKKHLDTIFGLLRLVQAYRNIGDSKKSLNLSKKCNRICKKTFGEDHPYFLESLRDIAVSYRDLGRNDKSLKLFEKCYDLMKIYLGENHPETLFVLNEYACIYGEIDILMGVKLNEKCYEIRKSLLGEKHQDTILSLSNLAVYVYRKRDYDRFRDLSENLYYLNCEVLGEKDTETIRCLDDYAHACNMTGDIPKSFELYDKLYKLCLIVYGEDHEITKDVFNRMKAVQSMIDDN